MERLRIEGIIAAYVSARAFGFIVTEEKDVRRFFFHLTSIVEGRDRIAEGQRVSFTVNPIREGKCFSAEEIIVSDQSVVTR